MSGGAPGPGEVLEGTWRIDAELRRGPSGAVYAATDLKLGRKVAIRWLGRAELEPEALERLQREAAILAEAAHPNIVALHVLGWHQGAPYLVMQWVDGISVPERVLERGGLSVAEVLALAEQLCAALGHLHQRGLLHRDLKPSNLMVNAQGHLTVIDLGLARRHDSRLTRTGVVHGTPGYMAPEAIAGETRLDVRADLYSLGALLFELFTGVPPFAGLSGDELLRAHLTRAPPLAHQVRSSLPPALSDVLARALALRPEDRFASAGELLAALRAAVVESPAAQLAPEAPTPPAGRAAWSAPVRRSASQPDAPVPTPVRRTASQPDAPAATPIRRSASQPDAPAATPIRRSASQPDAPAATPPRIPSRPEHAAAPAPAVAPSQLPTGVRRPLASPEPDPDEPRWYQRPVFYWSATTGAALLLSVAAVFWPSGEPNGPPPPQPLPVSVVGMEAPPAPPAPKEPPAQTPSALTQRELEARRAAVPTILQRPGPALRKGRGVPPMKLSRTYKGRSAGKGVAGLILVATLNEKPVEALVEIDGVFKGVTPLQTTIAAGEHALRIDYRKTRLTEFSTSFEGGKVARVEVELRTPEEASRRSNPPAPEARRWHE